ncbi:hypothetical protein PILCRDRAFT_267546 [Piloderma croceum F 1598]|uniref:Extracellular membrane protein CFEM domain-containing protein n=1 Tax=Piloderma croceum (strain F 1598) TaxID=765440 RepID=A0A0C3FUD0_PILCF|nr:hypothetical protein PILCRDRAFT_267546 [Piloderma croceum F 1598]
MNRSLLRSLICLTAVSKVYRAMALTPTETIQRLGKRQSPSGINPSEFPSQCQSECTTSLNAISACSGLSCVCTTSNLSGIQSCINCIVSTDSSLESVGQSVLSTYNTECAGQGVSSLTLGGSTGTAASAVASSTGSGSASSGSKMGAASKVGWSMMGVVGGGVVGGVAAILL